MKNNHDHELAREKLWCDAWLSVARSSNAQDVNACNNWADHALAEFDERFSPEAHEERQEKIKKDI